MDWIKQNNFLATFGGIMLLGILGLGFFVISNWKGYSAAIEEFDDTRSTLESLEGSSLHPNPENLEKVKTAVDAYETSVDALYTKLKSEQPELPTDVDVTKFGEKIQEKLNPMMASAKTAGITVGDNFYMGMDRYRTEQPPNDTEVLQKLEWSLGGIAVLAGLTIDAGIESIDEFRRYEEPWENPSAKPAVVEKKNNRRSSGRREPAKPVNTQAKMADITEAARVRMRLTGTPESVTEFFNLISNNKEYFFWIRWAKISNEVAKGPDRNQAYAPIPVGDDPIADGDVPVDLTPPTPPPAPTAEGDGDGETPEGDAPVVAFPDEEVAPAMIDVFPILGTERVRADVVIDILRFRDPPAPAKEENKRSR
ncbi:MAG: Amuc_1100 family pilus-like protein [Verrucomicrobiales bacterium]